MLRITIHEDEKAVAITLAGRVAGPWLAELNRAWSETAPRLDNRKLSLDLRDVTYCDAGSKQFLREIYEATNAELITGSLWAQHLADEIRTTNADDVHKENRHGNDA